MATLISKNKFVSNPLSIRIVPGTNVVPADDLEKLLKFHFVQTQIDLGNYIIGETTVDHEIPDENIKIQKDIDKQITELINIPVKEAKKIILGPSPAEGILDILLLKKLKEEDRRKGTQDAIRKQLDFLLTTNIKGKK